MCAWTGDSSCGWGMLAPATWIAACPSVGPFGVGHKVGWEEVIDVLPFLAVEMLAGGLEVNEDVGKEASLQRVRTSVDQRAGLVQHHVTWLHRHIHGAIVAIVHLQDPWLIHVLIDVDDAGADERKAVNVRRQDSAFLVHADSVEGRWRQLHACPLLDGWARGIPNLLLEARTTAAELGVLDTDHVGVCRPVVGVDVANPPVLNLHLVSVLIPVVLEQIEQWLWCTELLEAGAGVVDHALRLSAAHLQTILLGAVAAFGALLAPLGAATGHVLLVDMEPIA
mmetsp:Transcript_16018/g.44362  ORF Transcript_16018/g.44362 Transcript_16018/m.44362 type:complete len:281 (+) Transcript_16018:303-1145(+)